MPQLSEQEEFEMLSLERERALAGSNTPQIGSVPDIKALHASNQAAEAAAYEGAKRGTELSSAALRGAGGIIGMVPAVGPLLAGGVDVAAQMVEKAGGQRQTYNPARTAVEAGLSAIPGAPIAKMLAKPAPGFMASAGRAAAITGAHSIEGAVRGAGATAATSLSEMEIPTSGQLRVGAASGMMLSPLASVFSLNQLRRVTKRSTSAYDAASHVAKAVNLPPGTEHGAENLKEGVALALTHGASVGKPANTMEDLSKVSREARKIFGKAHIDPLKASFGKQIIDPKPILAKANEGLRSIHFAADPALEGKLADAKQILSEPRSASDLLEYYHIVQSEIQPFIKADPAARAEKFGDAEWRFKLRLKSALQDKLADHFDQSRALQEGTTVEALRSSGNGFKSIHRQYGSLRLLSDLSSEANERLKNTRMTKAGELFSPAVAVEKVLGPLVLSKRRMAGQALEMAIGGRNDPDKLVRKAQKVFSRYGSPAQRPEPMSSPRFKPPTKGQTVPIEVGPVPRPIVGGQQLQPYAGSERRGFGRNPNLSPEVIEVARGQALQGGVELSERQWVQNFLNNITSEQMASIRGNDKLSEAIQWAENAYRTRRSRGTP